MLHQVLLQISRINPVFIQELPFFKGDYSNLKSVIGLNPVFIQELPFFKRDYSNLKSVMRLQDQVFKICIK